MQRWIRLWALCSQAPWTWLTWASSRRCRCCKRSPSSCLGSPHWVLNGACSTRALSSFSSQWLSRSKPTRHSAGRLRLTVAAAGASSSNGWDCSALSKLRCWPAVATRLRCFGCDHTVGVLGWGPDWRLLSGGHAGFHCRNRCSCLCCVLSYFTLSSW